jgi:hypothetical protein
MKLNNHVQATLLLASFIWALVAIQGCETTHVVHVHHGKPVIPESSTTGTPETTGEVQATATSDPTLLPIDITMILDSSGSMETLTEQVITSYNDFLEEQKTVDGEATVSLVQFNHIYSPVYEGVDLHSANHLNSDNYKASGNTALFDAIGRAIAETRERITPGTADVVFVITTDGLENASQEYSGSQIKEMIEECESQYGWHFMYLAASTDAFNQHTTLGIAGATCYQLAPTTEGWKDSQQLMSIQLIRYRDSRQKSDLEFRDADRVDNE